MKIWPAIFSPNKKTTMFNDFEIISSYSRAQALEDGFLCDVTETAKEAGFLFPVAVTAGVYADIEKFNPKGPQSIEGRLWDILTMLRYAIKATPGPTDTVKFSVIMQVGNSKRQDYWAKIGPGDTPEPVITVMKPGED